MACTRGAATRRTPLPKASPRRTRKRLATPGARKAGPRGDRFALAGNERPGISAGREARQRRAPRRLPQRPALPPLKIRRPRSCGLGELSRFFRASQLFGGTQ